MTLFGASLWAALRWPPDPADYRITRRNAGLLLRRLAELLFLLLVPACLLFIALHPSGDNYAFDFRIFWEAGHAFVDGTSPYPEQSAAVIATKHNFLYPAAIAALFAPFALLPFGLAAALFLTLVAAAPILTLRLLGVRDWRCYGAVFLGLPVVFSVALGTISTFLALGIAVLWRCRDRPIVAAPVLALLVLSKLFLWPLALWFVVTRRVGTALAAAALAALASVVAWWHVGFETLHSYPDLLRLVAEVEQSDSFSPTSLAIALGVPAGAAQTTSLVAGFVLFLLVALRRNWRDDDFTMLVLALAAAFVCSPILWGHYLVVLFVPLAIARPRFGAIWLATFWMAPDNLPYGSSELARTAATALGLAATAAVLAVSLRTRWRDGAFRRPNTNVAPARV